MVPLPFCFSTSMCQGAGGRGCACPASNLLELNRTPTNLMPRPHFRHSDQTGPWSWWLCNVAPPAAVTVNPCPWVAMTRRDLFIFPVFSRSLRLTKVKQGWARQRRRANKGRMELNWGKKRRLVFQKKKWMTGWHCEERGAVCQSKWKVD